MQEVVLIGGNKRIAPEKFKNEMKNSIIKFDQFIRKYLKI